MPEPKDPRRGAAYRNEPSSLEKLKGALGDGVDTLRDAVDLLGEPGRVADEMSEGITDALERNL